MKKCLNASVLAGASILALTVLPRSGTAQRLTPADLVGTWLGKEVQNGKVPSADGPGLTFTLVLKDTMYTESTNGKNERIRPRRWTLVGDILDFAGEKYKINAHVRDSTYKAITEFRLSPPMIPLHTADTTTWYVYRRANESKP